MDLLLQHSAWWFFVALTVLPALYMLFTKDVMRAAFALLATFLGVAGLYVFTQAYFLAVTQIMVYVGGVLVLIIFGIMLSAERGSTFKIETGTRNVFVGLGVVLSVFLGLGYLALSTVWAHTTIQTLAVRKTMYLGVELMTKFILPFEIAGLLLLVALIAAVFISKDMQDD